MNKKTKTAAFLAAPKTLISTMVILGLSSQVAMAAPSSVESLESRIADLEQRLTDAKTASDVEFKVGGYIKLDAVAINAAEGDQNGNIVDTFYVPGATPVASGSTDGNEWDSHFSAQESRVWINAKKALDNGDKLSGHIQIDFFSLGATGGDERVSNSYAPRLRHAFIKYNNLLFGQTWSNAMHLHALPDGLDFAPLADGRVFVRQAMVKWSPTDSFSISLENNSTTITPFGGGSRITADDGYVPDVIAKWSPKVSWGSFSIAGIARRLSYNDTANDTETNAYGVTLGSKIKIGQKDDLRLGLIWGDGMGRYLGLNSGNDAVLDSNGDLQTIEQLGARIAYRHFWNEKLRSTIGYSVLSTDNSAALTGTGVTKESSSALVNLIYQATPGLQLGAEFMHAEREIESGADGDQDRVHFVAK